MIFKFRGSNSLTSFYKTVILIILGLLWIFDCYSQQTVKPYKHYIGRFIYYAVQHDKPIFGKDGMDTMLIFDNYALETIYSLRMNSTTTISTTTKEQKNIVNGVKRKFINYYLFDFNKGICMRLDSNQGKVHVKSSFPIAEKKDGLVLKPQIDENELSAFRFIKDTIVDHATYKLLEINYPGNPPGNFIKKKTLWLDPQLKNFLFDPISKSLDEKFDGTILSYIETKTDGKNTASGGVMGNYKNGLTTMEVQLMKKFISATNQGQ